MDDCNVLTFFLPSKVLRRSHQFFRGIADSLPGVKGWEAKKKNPYEPKRLDFFFLSFASIDACSLPPRHRGVLHALAAALVYLINYSIITTACTLYMHATNAGPAVWCDFTLSTTCVSL
jgi:hypothetical protein